MQADYSAYGSEPSHRASTELESYDPRQRQRRAGRTIALLLAALAIPGAIAGVVALVGGADSGGGSDDPAPDPSYAAPPLQGDGFTYAVLRSDVQLLPSNLGPRDESRPQMPPLG